jgi:hypothetical protein
MNYKVIGPDGEDAGTITIEDDPKITSPNEVMAAARVLGMAFHNGVRCAVIRPNGEKVTIKMHDYVWEIVEFEWAGYVTWTKHNRQDFIVTAPTRKDAMTKIEAAAAKIHPYPLFQGFVGTSTELPYSYLKSGTNVFIKTDEASDRGIAGRTGLVQRIRPNGQYRIQIPALDNKEFDVEPLFLIKTEASNN